MYCVCVCVCVWVCLGPEPHWSIVFCGHPLLAHHNDQLYCTDTIYDESKIKHVINVAQNPMNYYWPCVCTLWTDRWMDEWNMATHQLYSTRLINWPSFLLLVHLFVHLIFKLLMMNMMMNLVFFSYWKYFFFCYVVTFIQMSKHLFFVDIFPWNLNLKNYKLILL